MTISMCGISIAFDDDVVFILDYFLALIQSYDNGVTTQSLLLSVGASPAGINLGSAKPLISVF